MFGYVRPHLPGLTEAEQTRYRAHYCGLCRALGARHGEISRIALTFDLTFLTIFLSSLYEPQERQGTGRCLPHPVHPHAWAVSEVTDYAADMTVALTWHKCRDDWQDDRSLAGRAGMAALRRSYDRVKSLWPDQCAAIEQAMADLAEVEKRRDPSPDAAPNCFGRLMAAVFLMRRDYWAPALAAFGHSLGRYVYLLDAVCDLERDAKRGSYNPVLLTGREPEEMRGILEMQLGDASSAFEKLPLIQDEGLLRNVLYAGLWQGYAETLNRRAKKRGGLQKTKSTQGKEAEGHGE